MYYFRKREKKTPPDSLMQSGLQVPNLRTHLSLPKSEGLHNLQLGPALLKPEGS